MFHIDRCDNVPEIHFHLRRGTGYGQIGTIIPPAVFGEFDCESCLPRRSARRAENEQPEAYSVSRVAWIRTFRPFSTWIWFEANLFTSTGAKSG